MVGVTWVGWRRAAVTPGRWIGAAGSPFLSEATRQKTGDAATWEKVSIKQRGRESRRTGGKERSDEGINEEDRELHWGEYAIYQAEVFSVQMSVIA
jgi:hypothetical protein